MKTLSDGRIFAAFLTVVAIAAGALSRDAHANAIFFSELTFSVTFPQAITNTFGFAIFQRPGEVALTEFGSGVGNPRPPTDPTVTPLGGGVVGRRGSAGPVGGHSGPSDGYVYELSQGVFAARLGTFPNVDPVLVTFTGHYRYDLFTQIDSPQDSADAAIGLQIATSSGAVPFSLFREVFDNNPPPSDTSGDFAFNLMFGADTFVDLTFNFFAGGQARTVSPPNLPTFPSTFPPPNLPSPIAEPENLSIVGLALFGLFLQRRRRPEAPLL
jgi:hypothetical protein